MNIGLGESRKTILLIDADPHARAVLRTALEAARFSVGEAASNREGERTIARIKPDAVLADLLGDPSDAGLTISEWIRTNHDTIPCYIVSTAGEALVGSVGLHELGVTGVFLKPVDTALVIQTLRTQLAVAPGDDGHA
jgi:two-component system OmpR family response regulator